MRKSRFLGDKRHYLTAPLFVVEMLWIDGESAPSQGRRIRGFEGARAPPEHTSAPSHCQKHPLKMKGKLSETSFQTDIQPVKRLTYVSIDERGLVRSIHLFLFSCVHWLNGILWTKL